MIIKKDKNAEIFFDPTNGFKMRVSMDDMPYEKSSTPELVDLKITDKCPYGCSFCYQGSLPDAEHASTLNIMSIIHTLSEMNVFEVAIGGGEPAEHPNFDQILEQIHFSGMVPNFTCFGTKWLKEQHIVQAVENYVGGIGVSVHNVKQINKFHKIRDAFKGKGKVKILAQHVLGTVNFEDTMKIIKGCNHILLLGYKNVGFGPSFQPHYFTEWEMKDLIKTAKKLSVDTAFVEKFERILGEMGIRNELISSPEGKFSMYIDAVDNLMAPSSYIEKKDMDKVNLHNTSAVIEQYKRY